MRRLARSFHRRMPPIRSRSGGIGTFLILAGFFLAGSLLGSLLSAGTLPADVTSLITEAAASRADALSFLSAFWGIVTYPLLLFFAATSLAGVLAAPICIAFRGYLFTCASASILMTFPENGWLLALVTLGLPALLSLPCTFALAMDAVQSSLCLLQSSGRGERTAGLAAFVRHFFLLLPFFLAGAAIETAFTPYLIGLMIE